MNPTLTDSHAARCPVPPLVWALLALVGGLVALTTPRCLGDRAIYDPTKTEIALPISAPPVIDGTVDNAEWGPATPFSVAVDSTLADGIQNGTMTSGTVLPADNNDLSFQIRVKYDTNNLYIAVQVLDSVIMTDSAEAGSRNGNTWMDDSVEVFIDGANSNDATWTTNQLGGQFVITANNAYRENEAGNPGYGETAAWFAKTAPNAAGTGYDAEFRISLALLGNPKPGDIIGFSVGVNDDDDGGDAERQVMWAGQSHKPVTYGNLVLGGKSYSAPKVTSAPTIDGVFHASEYPNAAEIKVDTFNGIYDGGDDNWPLGDHDFSAWVVHDADAVYIAVDVTDDKVVTDTAEAGSEDGNTWEDDSVEIFFDADRDRENGKGTLGFEGQYVLTANGAHRDNEANNPTFGQDGDWYAATSKTATGYQIEFKIKKSALSNPADGATMGFHIAVNDDDGGTPAPKTQIGWSGYAHQEFSYGALTLAGTGGVPAITNLTVTGIKMTGNNLEISFTTPKPSSAHALEQSSKLPASAWSNVTNVTFSAPSGNTLAATFPKPSAAPAFYRVRLGDTPVTPACVTTRTINSWVNTSFPNQTNTFTATFDATPSDVAPFDVVMALSSGPRTAFADFACLVRFQTAGIIDARNGAGYEGPATDIPFKANVTYHFRLVVNTPAKTYSVYVTEAGGTEQLVGRDFAFRPTAVTPTNLNNWGVIYDIEGPTPPDSATVCNFKVVSP